MDQPQDAENLVEDQQLFAMKQIESKEGLEAVDGAAMMGEEDEDEAGVLIEAGAKPEGERRGCNHASTRSVGWGVAKDGEGGRREGWSGHRAREREREREGRTKKRTTNPPHHNDADSDTLANGSIWMPAPRCTTGHEDEGVDSDTLMEKALDDAYDEYLDRKGMLTKKVMMRKKTQTLGMAGPSAEDAPDNDYVPDDLSSDSEDDGNPNEEAHNPLVVQQRGAAAAKDKVTSQWFAQSQFAGMDDSDDDFDLPTAANDGGAGVRAHGGADVAAADAKLEAEAKAKSKKVGGFNVDSDSDSDSDGEEKAPDFEEVSAAAHAPKPKDMSKNLDAHGLALAAEMILRKRKREIVDNAYNRFTFDDPVKPAWFEDEEQYHIVSEVPMTKEMAEDIKQREREINARPIKKVLEAKGRLKRRTVKEKAKTTQKATSINENTTLSEGEKAAEIRSVFAKARRAAKKGEDGKPTIVLARKGGGGKGVARPNGVTGKFTVVDKRYRADLAGKKRLDKRKKGGKRDKYKGRR